MEGPDPTLTAIYSTVSPGQEKTAEDKAIEKLSAALEAENVEFDKLSAEEQNALLDTASKAIAEPAKEGEAQGEGQPAAEAAQPEAEKEAQQKFAEADFMGRVMAHSQWDELRKLSEANGQAELTAAERVAGRLQGGEAPAVPAEKTAAEVAGEALEAAAQERALQILQENGIDPSKLQPVQQ